MDATSGGTGWLELKQEYRRSLDEGRLDKHRKRRWDKSREFAGWLDQDKLPGLSLDQALALYRASGGARTNLFKADPPEEIQDVLDFLLYDSVKLEGRFDECAAEGVGFKLDGAGKEFISYILCLRDPSLFAVWDNRSEALLRQVGMFHSKMRNGPMGIRYLDMLEILSQVRYHLNLADFQALDEMCYAAAAYRRRKAGPAVSDGAVSHARTPKP